MLQWEAPLEFPATATGTFKSMALTPDGSRLVVAGNVGTSTGGTTGQLIVLNPDDSSVASVFTFSGMNSSFTGSIATTKFNTVVMAGYPGAVFDLSTSTFTPIPASNRPGVDVVRASGDGSYIYGAVLNASSGAVYSIDPSTYDILRSTEYGYMFWSDLAVSADGTQIAGVFAPPFANGSLIGFFDLNLRYLNTNVYADGSAPDDTGVLGSMFSPGGKVLVVPLGDSLEIWDSALGTLRARVMAPEEFHKASSIGEGGGSPMMTMDATGQTIFIVSKSGLTVLALPQPLDQTPSKQWASNPYMRSSKPNAWLHGSITSRMKAMRSMRPNQSSLRNTTRTLRWIGPSR